VALAGRYDSHSALGTHYRTALVTGGTGLIGRPFVPMLSARCPGLAITVGTRVPAQRVPEGAQSVTFMNLPGPFSLDEPAEIVFHIAGINGTERTVMEVNFEGTRTVLNWARDHGVRRFVHVSSVAAYGAGSQAGVVDERWPRRPKDVYSTSKNMAEDAVRACCEEAGIDYVILQPGNVISAMQLREPQLLNLMRHIQRGLFFYLCRDEVTFNYIAADAVASGMCAALAPEAANRTFILNTPTDLRCVVKWIADELGVSAPKKVLPKSLGRFCGTLASAITRVSGVNLPFSYSRYVELTRRTRFSGDAITEALGFKYDPTLEVAIRRLARRYVNERML
jgi:dihydroflavonol-4-reductase